jgi:ribulose-phosphate 3-epimerase
MMRGMCVGYKNFPMYTNCTNCIIPAILPSDVTTLCATAERLTFTPKLQLDLVDGNYAAPATWPFEPHGTPVEVASVLERFDVQVDLMVVDPLTLAEAWVQAGAKELVIHIESIADLDPIKALRQRFQVPLWLAGGESVAPEAYLAHRTDIDGVQIMGISTIGLQGQPLSPNAVARVAALREADAALPIQVDGSVNADTIEALYTAGATDFVVGSAIVGAADPRAAYNELRERIPVCR